MNHTAKKENEKIQKSLVAWQCVGSSFMRLWTGRLHSVTSLVNYWKEALENFNWINVNNWQFSWNEETIRHACRLCLCHVTDCPDLSWIYVSVYQFLIISVLYFDGFSVNMTRPPTFLVFLYVFAIQYSTMEMEMKECLNFSLCIALIFFAFAFTISTQQRKQRTHFCSIGPFQFLFQSFAKLLQLFPRSSNSWILWPTLISKRTNWFNCHRSRSGYKKKPLKRKSGLYKCFFPNFVNLSIKSHNGQRKELLSKFSQLIHVDA
jgi:hypothetical protein